jgi:hypothetical protein
MTVDQVFLGALSVISVCWLRFAEQPQPLVTDPWDDVISGPPTDSNEPAPLV